MIGNEEFPASLLDLPAVVESFKTYDDSALVKTADIGQVRSWCTSLLYVFVVNLLIKKQYDECFYMVWFNR